MDSEKRLFLSQDRLSERRFSVENTTGKVAGEKKKTAAIFSRRDPVEFLRRWARGRKRGGL
jgi:hypothetical protein